MENVEIEIITNNSNTLNFRAKFFFETEYWCHHNKYTISGGNQIINSITTTNLDSTVLYQYIENLYIKSTTETNLSCDN